MAHVLHDISKPRLVYLLEVRVINFKPVSNIVAAKDVEVLSGVHAKVLHQLAKHCDCLGRGTVFNEPHDLRLQATQHLDFFHNAVGLLGG